MTFDFKRKEPVFNFGPHLGKGPSEVPEEYLHKMYGLARDSRIMDKDLSWRIIEVYNKRKENEAK